MKAMMARSIGERCARRPVAPLVVGRDELRLAPAQDRRDRDLPRRRGRSDHVLARRTNSSLDVVELLLEPLGGVGLAAQPAAADRAASEREEEPRLLELGQDRLLDLVERDGAPGGAVLGLLERARRSAGC